MEWNTIWPVKEDKSSGERSAGELVNAIIQLGKTVSFISNSISMHAEIIDGMFDASTSPASLISWEDLLTNERVPRVGPECSLVNGAHQNLTVLQVTNQNTLSGHQYLVSLLL